MQYHLIYCLLYILKYVSDLEYCIALSPMALGESRAWAQPQLFLRLDRILIPYNHLQCEIEIGQVAYQPASGWLSSQVSNGC